MKERGSGHGRSRSEEDLEGSLRTPLRDNEGGAHSASGNAPDVPKGEGERAFLGQSRPLPEQPADDHAKLSITNVAEWSVLSKALLALVIYFAVGILSFYAMNKHLFGLRTNTFVDALYFCAVTLTTVGYGDLVPSSTAGKFFTCAYFFVGFIVVSSLVNGAAEYLVGKQEAVLFHAIGKKDLEDVDFAAKENSHAEAALFKVYVSACMLLLVSIIGTIFLMAVEHDDFVDAFYCVIVTATTLGYGDHSFRTAPGRLFASIWIIMSTVCLAQFLLYMAEYRTVLRQLRLAHRVLHEKPTRRELEAADLDGDGYVTKAEFVLLKLRELKRIDQQDVEEISKDFEAIDYDHTGKVRVGDRRI